MLSINAGERAWSCPNLKCQILLISHGSPDPLGGVDWGGPRGVGGWVEMEDSGRQGGGTMDGT